MISAQASPICQAHRLIMRPSPLGPGRCWCHSLRVWNIDTESKGGGGRGPQTQDVCSPTPAARHQPFFTSLRECGCLSVPPSNPPKMSQTGAKFPRCQRGGQRGGQRSTADGSEGGGRRRKIHICGPSQALWAAGRRRRRPFIDPAGETAAGKNIERKK